MTVRLHGANVGSFCFEERMMTRIDADCGDADASSGCSRATLLRQKAR